MPCASPPLLEISAASNDLISGANSIDAQLWGCGYKKLSNSLLGPSEKQQKTFSSFHSIFPWALYGHSTIWLRPCGSLSKLAKLRSCRLSNSVATQSFPKKDSPSVCNIQ
ncbi:hypothetical protein FOXG_17907 [Fusarium oxysporum f. sp. lycopersici 4287]|uniref:Uncharacterized protein n=2 Tax=Fusarium oxysporum TaxID=5507 RepID=A0A0J9U6X0_FUSO4|nr:hypothetical protein FOXG_17907 [Fusarium oxysporum f. sp. lycopersici 4287]XP_018232730.1 hypothetical protein FOXG_17907 [Fusarium oxysporum f. sp. lycopersici 4287]EXK48334.1 hypothetical protein FOMG_01328 [Fusarium oxysporum f. sp. melonis 26406]EXK48335.1 hypothetical protein FOMG_01328 [Fusarium oxysporum f. sp. melonis 26406]KNA94683.1 hypothetical protein FOXG_17907 [Fusarium oxysporum f. sp. lycopersici 4287]KNA94684.1 hypothetical protein FOXG_17907 [Fusarium oxysporum f. sp. lyc